MGEESSEELLEDPLLRIKGVTQKLAMVMRDCGYFTVESVAIEPPHMLFERIGERAGFSLEKAEEITREARKLLKVNVMTIGQLEEDEKRRQVVSTGSRKLDEMLEGGMRSGELTGVSGPYSVGKTELVFTVALNTVRQLNAGAWVIDTEGTTSAKRLVQMGEALGIPSKTIKEKVAYSRVIGTADLIATIDSAHKVISDYKLKFIGVDTLVNPFRAEYPGRENLPERQFKLNRCLRRLLDYARTYDMIVLVTNQVHAAPVATSVYEHRPEILNPPTGGHVFLYVVNNHLYVEKAARPGVFIATLIDSSYLPRRQVAYTITGRGISDLEEKE